MTSGERFQSKTNWRPQTLDSTAVKWTLTPRCWSKQIVYTSVSLKLCLHCMFVKLQLCPIQRKDPPIPFVLVIAASLTIV